MRSVLLAAAAVAATAAFSAPTFAAELKNNATIVCDGNEKNRDTYLQMWKVLFMERDGSRAGEFYAPEIKSHNNDGGGAGGMVKTEDLAKMWAASKKYAPDRVLDDELILCAGDYVVVRTTIRSQDNTGVAGWPATGKPYTTTATDIYKFKDGKVVERWGNADLVNIFRQTGYAIVPEAIAPKPPAKPKAE
jgi:predicted ester cyclase